ncbi:hypothetical protein [Tannerella forsythia]|uniref:Uncharacterized protein n=1 Tax=Tannerella forsythia TaxID=28112 RepID=A0A3P1YUY7_TANFO|nr:hypothetical protein [Tannerella forsythia]RRD74437.1 hypothetical protein EII41_08085 [Tannerella forsythia]
MVTQQAGRKPEEKITAAISYPLAPRSDYGIKVGQHEVRQNYINLDFVIGNQQDLYAVKLLRGYYLQSDLVPLSIDVGYQNYGDTLKAFAIDTTAIHRGIILYCLQPYDI